MQLTDLLLTPTQIDVSDLVNACKVEAVKVVCRSRSEFKQTIQICSNIWNIILLVDRFYYFYICVICHDALIVKSA